MPSLDQALKSRFRKILGPMFSESKLNDLVREAMEEVKRWSADEPTSHPPIHPPQQGNG